MRSPATRLAFLFALATVLVALVAAQAVNPPGAPADHFLSYKVKKTKGTTKFTKVPGVHLANELDDVNVDVTTAADLLVPVAAAGDPVVDGATHLRSHKIKAVKGSAKHVKRLRVPITNYLGTLLVDTVKPDLLLVPTAVDLTVSPPPPEAASHDVDHFSCYLVKISKGTPKLAKGLQVTVQDPFTHVSRVLTLLALKHLCVPVDKKSEGIKNPAGKLACYTVKRAKGEPKHLPQRGLKLNNQFAPLSVDTAKENELCVPAVAPIPTPTPGPNTTTTPTPGVTATSATPTVESTAGLPPDPEDVAPPLDAAIASNPAFTTSFLYDGDDPIQTGVVQNAINARRAAVLRGKVLGPTNAPLFGARVTVLGHPELGETLSRADGMFDLAVNGGGLLTVSYEKTGFLPLQRQAYVPWHEFVTLPDVMLTPFDAQMTVVDLTQGGMHTARGSVRSDADGTRQATLLLPAGTTAVFVAPNGDETPASQLSIRATEYTVGANGPKSMPGDLPASSAYTYAVEFSADEAIDAGVKQITFNQPVFHYVENFLNFPVGTPVPTGFYDRQRGVWVASANGVVIAILSITSGRADLDTDGDGNVDNGAALGVNDSERQQLATLYAAGQTLWRVPIPHFSTVDCNWPFVPPADARTAGSPPPTTDDPVEQCLAEEEVASVVECENQTLGESVPVVGTPFTLNYRSDRVPGRQGARTVSLVASGATVPASLEGIQVSLQIAGQTLTQTLQPNPNQNVSFTWDGRDAYGRLLQGRQPYRAQIDYVYGAVYATPAEAAAAFGAFGAAPISGDRTREEITIGQVLTGALGTFDARGYGLGGWTLDVHHAYDPEGQILYRGDGRRVSAIAIRSGVATVAGGGNVTAVTGIQARTANLARPFSMVFTADGTLFFSIPSQHRIGRVGLDGVLALFGTGPGFGGDGQLLGFGLFNDPQGVAISSEGVGYVADRGNNRVRRAEPIGTLSTFAGNGGNGFSGDGGLAVDAELSAPNYVAVGPDGSVYIADDGNGRIRRVGTDGIIHTFAGGGAVSGNQIDGIPALNAQLSTIGGLAVDLRGNVYFANGNTIIRVGADGMATRLAGDFDHCDFDGDDGPAKLAELCDPTGLTLDPDGNLYIGDRNNDRVRVIGTDGIISTAMGGGTDDSTEEAPATQALVGEAQGPAIAPDGSLYVSAFGPSRIRRLQSSLPAFEAASFSVASDDGASVFQFDPVGRHLRTLDALTGGTLYEFGYDGAGRLSTVVDGDGNTTHIERDGNGVPTAIIGPYGQRTELALDGNGFLASVENPAGEAVTLTYASGGLLTAFTDPRGNASQYDYDDLGLLEVADPAGPSTQTLSRTDFATGHQVTRTTALGRTFTSEVARAADGNQLLTSTAPDGTQRQTSTQRDGLQTSTFTDGTTSASLAAPDPRFGLEAPVSASYSVQLPSTLTLTSASTRVATLADPNDPFSLVSLQNITSVNGRTAVGTYTAATRTFVTTTTEGRTETVTIDALGRIVQSQFGDLDPVHVVYDSNGRVESSSVGSGPNTRTLLFTYDDDGYVATITDPLGRTSQLAYDAAGRVTSKTLPGGGVVSFAYDAAGNVTSVTPPGRPAYVHGYSSRNEPTLFTPPAVPGSGSSTIAYNADSAVTNVSRGGVQTVAIGYDASGRPATRTLTTGAGLPTVDTFTYDAAGRLGTIAAGGSGITLTTAYDGVLPISTTWAGPVAGSVGRAYDSTLRLASQSVNGANPVAFTYDDDGLLTGAGSLTIARDVVNGLGTGTTLANVATTRSYNGLGEPTGYAVTASGNPLYGATYVRDAIGRITQKTETIAGVTDTYVYAYDVTGQLDTVTKNGGQIENYDYGTNGNRVSATVNGVGAAATYDAQDRLTQYGTTTFGYDAAGDLTSQTTSGQQTTYGYDPLGNLLEVSLPSGTTVTYLVDGYGRRIGREVDGTLVQGLLYDDPLRPIAALDGAGAVVSRFVYSGGTTPAYMIKAGATLRLVADQVGSVRLVVDASTGAIVQRLDYDSFGNVLTDTNPGFQPFGYAGGLYDPTTKLVRFGLRDYDPRTGRWTAQDLLGFRGNDHNLYRYCANDPVNRHDVAGLDNWDAAQGFVDQMNEEIQVAANPLFGVTLLIDAAIKGVASALGFDAGPTMSEQLFHSSPTFADRSSEDYATGELAGVCVGVVGGLFTGGTARAGLRAAAREAALESETLARQGRIAERLAARDGQKVDFAALSEGAADVRNAGQRFVQSAEEEVVEVLKGWKTGGGGNGILSGGGW